MIKDYSMHRSIMQMILKVRTNVGMPSVVCCNCPFANSDFKKLMGIDAYNIYRRCASFAKDRSKDPSDYLSTGCVHEVIIRIIKHLINDPNIEVTRKRSKR